MRTVLLYFSLILFLQFGGSPQLMAQTADFKIIGYLPYYRFDLADQIEFDKLTHLNLAFANPNSVGGLSFEGENIDPIVEMAHAANVDVFVSLAGGALTSEWSRNWEKLMKSSNRAAFIHKIIEYVQRHDLQGVDMDLEWSHVNAKYSPFVIQLSDSLQKYNMPLTAALPGTTRYPDITKKALERFDWVNMMVYDLTGNWAADQPGPHSPYSFAVESIDFWKDQGMSSDKLTLGVPFYGKDFSDPNKTKTFTFAQIVTKNSANANRDKVGKSYWNGIPTIKSKTRLAMRELSGIMIWELGQDSFGEYSLLNAIFEEAGGISPVHNIEIIDLKVYPNPFSEYIVFENNANENVMLYISDLLGRTISQQSVSALSKLQINMNDLNSGMYVLNWKTAKQSGSFKMVKQ